MPKQQQQEFNVEFCDRIIQGRKYPKEYSKLLLTFGDIFLKRSSDRKSNLCGLIIEGNTVCKLMTKNMEALMRTIVYIGCSKDWPNYLNSPEYQRWILSQRKEKMASISIQTRDTNNKQQYCQQDDSESETESSKYTTNNNSDNDNDSNRYTVANQVSSNQNTQQTYGEY